MHARNAHWMGDWGKNTPGGSAKAYETNIPPGAGRVKGQGGLAGDHATSKVP
jgi:hypothetical protein